MLCVNCPHDNPTGAKFCNACGAKLDSSCPQCGQTNPTGSRFCNACGASLTGKSKIKRQKSKGKNSSSNPQHLTPSTQHPISYTPRHLAERILAEQAALEARGAPDGERKTITALFADMAGFT